MEQYNKQEVKTQKSPYRAADDRFNNLQFLNSGTNLHQIIGILE
jgi:hypothetical protein